GVGRVILLGDAAHSMTPNLGQGAATAIEDAGALGLLWPRAGEAVDLPAALTALRRARVEALHRVSWRIGQVAHWRSPIARWLRDALLRAMSASAVTRGARRSWEPGIELAARLREALAREDGCQ